MEDEFEEKRGIHVVKGSLELNYLEYTPRVNDVIKNIDTSEIAHQVHLKSDGHLARKSLQIILNPNEYSCLEEVLEELILRLPELIKEPSIETSMSPQHCLTDDFDSQDYLNRKLVYIYPNGDFEKRKKLLLRKRCISTWSKLLKEFTDSLDSVISIDEVLELETGKEVTSLDEIFSSHSKNIRDYVVNQYKSKNMISSSSTRNTIVYLDCTYEGQALKCQPPTQLILFIYPLNDKKPIEIVLNKKNQCSPKENEIIDLVQRYKIKLPDTRNPFASGDTQFAFRVNLKIPNDLIKIRLELPLEENSSEVFVKSISFFSRNSRIIYLETNTWLSRKTRDGSISREYSLPATFHLFDFKVDPIQDRLPEIMYEISFATIDFYGSSMNEVSIIVDVFGGLTNSGKRHLIALDLTMRHSFERNSETSFQIKSIYLGPLEKIFFVLNMPINRKKSIYFEFISIKEFLDDLTLLRENFFYPTSLTRLGEEQVIEMFENYSVERKFPIFLDNLTDDDNIIECYILEKNSRLKLNEHLTFTNGSAASTTWLLIRHDSYYSSLRLKYKDKQLTFNTVTKKLSTSSINETNAEGKGIINKFLVTTETVEGWSFQFSYHNYNFTHSNGTLTISSEPSDQLCISFSNLEKEISEIYISTNCCQYLSIENYNIIIFGEKSNSSQWILQRENDGSCTFETKYFPSLFLTAVESTRKRIKLATKSKESNFILHHRSDHIIVESKAFKNLFLKSSINDGQCLLEEISSDTTLDDLENAFHFYLSPIKILDINDPNINSVNQVLLSQNTENPSLILNEYFDKDDWKISFRQSCPISHTNIILFIYSKEHNSGPIVIDEINNEKRIPSDYIVKLPDFRPIYKIRLEVSSIHDLSKINWTFDKVFLENILDENRIFFDFQGFHFNFSDQISNLSHEQVPTTTSGSLSSTKDMRVSYRVSLVHDIVRTPGSGEIDDLGDSIYPYFVIIGTICDTGRRILVKLATLFRTSTTRNRVLTETYVEAIDLGEITSIIIGPGTVTDETKMTNCLVIHQIVIHKETKSAGLIHLATFEDLIFIPMERTNILSDIILKPASSTNKDIEIHVTTENSECISLSCSDQDLERRSKFKTKKKLSQGMQNFFIDNLAQSLINTAIEKALVRASENE